MRIEFSKEACVDHILQELVSRQPLYVGRVLQFSPGPGCFLLLQRMFRSVGYNFLNLQVSPGGSSGVGLHLFFG